MAYSLPLRALLLVPIVVVGLGAGACSQALPAAVATPSATAATSHGPDVIFFEGVRDVRFGQTREQLTEAPGLNEGPGGCGEHIVGLTEVSPVFTDESAGEKLVLLWANPPLRTPEHIGVGAEVSAVKAAYPQAKALIAPAETYRFDGLLVNRGEFGFLFLHDGKHVQKLIAGYGAYLQRLFDEGFGAC